MLVALALEGVASSSEAMRSLELFAVRADEGPRTEAYRTGEPVVDIDLAAAGGRRPRLAAPAAGERFRLAHSLPMRLCLPRA